MQIRYISNARIPTEKAHGVQIMSMCEAFAGLGHDVELVVPRKHDYLKVNPFEYYGIKNNFRIRALPIFDIGSKSEKLPKLILALDLLSFIWKLRTSRIAEKGDILYLRDFQLLFAFSPRKNPLIIEVHHIYGWRKVFVRALRRATRVVAITQALKGDLVALGLSADRIIVAPDAVNISLFANVESRDIARRRLGLGVEKKIALYIGRIDKWKGTDVLFEATKHLRDIQIAVIGNGPEDTAVLQARHPTIVFLGFRPYREIADNQAAADVLVLPNSGKEEISARFTSPLKLFTYMASKKPIVVADLPSMREVLSEKEAFFFRADDPVDLARSIEEALDTTRSESRAESAYQKVLSYSWRARAKHILDAISAA